MPFVELRVRLADRPGALEVLAGAVAAVGANIVSVDVQHVHDGHAIDVLSIRLPGRVDLESLRVAVADALGHAEVGCRWADRDVLTDPIVRALEVVHTVASRPDDVAGFESGLCRLVDAEQAWVVPAPPAGAGWIAQAAATGLPMTRRSLDVRCGAAGEPTSSMVLPLAGSDALVAIVTRPHGGFTDSEVARGMALGRAIAGVGAGSAAWQSPRHGPIACGPHTVRTRHGRSVVVRPAVPSDRVAVLALHARCSDTTLYRRFFGGMPILHRRVLDTLVGVSRHDNVTLVAEGTEGRLVAVANVMATPDDTVDAEIGLLVEDAWQDRGIGTALFELLREAASRREWHWLAAYTQADNARMRHLLAGVPGARPCGLDHGGIRVELPAGERSPARARPATA